MSAFIKGSAAQATRAQIIEEFDHRRELLADEVGKLRTQLEASQASEARLREAVKMLVSWKEPASLCAPELGGMLTAMYLAEAVLSDTEPNPVSAVIEAARAWQFAETEQVSANVRKDARYHLHRALDTLDTPSRALRSPESEVPGVDGPGWPQP